jgi:hypothetical protein
MQVTVRQVDHTLGTFYCLMTEYGAGNYWESPDVFVHEHVAAQVARMLQTTMEHMTHEQVEAVLASPMWAYCRPVSAGGK